ncbi:MAG TPA: DUF5655 domain-containing protein [Actinomycetes bacterium]
MRTQEGTHLGHGRRQLAPERQVRAAWLPGQWLSHPATEVVLSVARARHDQSPHFKPVAHPALTVWMHHLELRCAAELDDEVADWLREAYERAG